jgi:hypothetical protein
MLKSMKESLRQTTLVALGTLPRFANCWLGGLATGLSHRRPGISHSLIHVGILLNEDMPFFLICIVGGWSPNWVHSARRSLSGLLYLPRVIVRMENLVE